MEDDLKTLWVGDLEPQWDEGYLHSMFAATGQVEKTKIITSGGPTPFGFVEFQTKEMAAQVLAGYNNQNISGTNKVYRLNWAQHNVGAPKPPGGGPPGHPGHPMGGGGTEYSIFVGDLSPEVSDEMLVGSFAQHYGSIKAAQVMVDSATGQSKKYGFVRFWDQGEQVRAQQEMNGQLINGRAIRCGPAQPKNTPVTPAPPYPGYGAPPAAAPGYSAPPPAVAAGYSSAAGYPPAYPGYGAPAPAPAYPGYPPAEGYPPAVDPAAAGAGESTVFIGGLDGNTSEEQLNTTFAYFGAIRTCRVPDGKHCGFIEFHYAASAEQAIATMHNQFIGSSQVRCEYGKSKTASEAAAAAGYPGYPPTAGAEDPYAAQWQEYYAQQAAEQQAKGAVPPPALPPGPVPGPSLPAPAPVPNATPAAAETPGANHVDGITIKLDVEAINKRYLGKQSKFLRNVRVKWG